MRQKIIGIAIFIILLMVKQVQALEVGDIPHVNLRAIESYQFDYSSAAEPRAFAIAPGGAWAWQAEADSMASARSDAVKKCEGFTEQKCIVFAENDDVVFDRDSWYTLWGPYKKLAEAKKAEQGTHVGQRFPDIRFTTPQGFTRSLHDLQGKVVFVHFWGCWCPSCRVEFMTMIEMYQVVKSLFGDEVEFVLLQLREPIEQARRWAKKNNVDKLPLSDSGVQSEEETQLTLDDGSKIEDRSVAKVFPATYVLDKHGLVVFSHMGSVYNWTEYVYFIKHAVENSGK